MSAHYGAPGLRRAQLATPAYSASPQGSSIPARSGGAPVVRRKALFVAAATLCAPALAAMALAAIGATGGGGAPAIGSLVGSQGLRGTTTPAVSSPAPAPPEKQHINISKGDVSGPPAAHVQKDPAPSGASGTPVHRPAPAPPPQRVKPAPHVNVPTTPAYDPSQPGAPTTSGSTSGTGGSSSSGTSGTPGSGNNGGTVDGYDAYPGGG